MSLICCCPPRGRRRRASGWPKRLGYVMVMLVLAMVVWSYRCFVRLVGEVGMAGKGWRESVVLFHLLLVPLLVSYWRCVFSDPSGNNKVQTKDFVFVPSVAGDVASWDENNCDEMLDELMRRGESLGLRDVDDDGVPRYCWDCQLIKPDRCHHCSLCDHCILKFDHHCPWINNCVGHSNHKYFICFLFWTLCTLALVNWFESDCALPCVTASPDSLPCQSELLYHFVISLSLQISVGFFLFFHAYLLASGLTTLEFLQARFGGGASRRSSSPPMFQSAFANLQTSLGTDVWFWLVPSEPKGTPDGVTWDVQLTEVRLAAYSLNMESRTASPSLEGDDDDDDEGGADTLREEEVGEVLQGFHERLDRITRGLTASREA